MNTRIPAWAITNTLLLFTPIILGLGVFSMWFVPNPSIKLPAVIFLALYYTVVFRIGKRTSGVKSRWAEFQKTHPTWREYSWSALGFVMFLLLGFAGIYVTSAALITSAFGTDVEKEFTVSAFYDPYQRRCDYLLLLKGLSPVLGNGFCVSSNDAKGTWRKDSKVRLYGRESILGFRFTRIGS
jgi:hypothetical protein